MTRSIQVGLEFSEEKVLIVLRTQKSFIFIAKSDQKTEPGVKDV